MRPLPRRVWRRAEGWKCRAADGDRLSPSATARYGARRYGQSPVRSPTSALDQERHRTGLETVKGIGTFRARRVTEPSECPAASVSDPEALRWAAAVASPEAPRCDLAATDPAGPRGTRPTGSVEPDQGCHGIWPPIGVPVVDILSRRIGLLPRPQSLARPRRGGGGVEESRSVKFHAPLGDDTAATSDLASSCKGHRSLNEPNERRGGRGECGQHLTPSPSSRAPRGGVSANGSVGNRSPWPRAICERSGVSTRRRPTLGHRR